MAQLNALDPNGPLNAFNANGPTYLVGSAASVQILPNAGPPATGVFSYRVRNLSSGQQYFSWGVGSGVTSVGAPSLGTPSANTIGMNGNSVETFTFPPYCWMIAGTTTGFEVTPGTGL
jgi:hypothetical protein